MTQNGDGIGLLSDNPKKSKEYDEFGFNAYVNLLGKSITATDDLPFTVGIFGEWGTGKTTLMHFLNEWFIDKECKTIWFDPWKYERKEEVRDALIRAILLKIEYDTSKDDKIDSLIKSKIKNDVTELIKGMAWTALKAGASYISGGVIQGSVLDKVKQNIITIKEKEYDFLSKFNDRFSEIVKKYVGENGRLIIFIDDLDRCIPDNVIIILESIKLYLDNPHCVFVLGMDKKIVEQAIKLRYKEQIDISGREYLDKIIQLPFFIPHIQYEKLNDYLKSATKAIDYDDNIWLLVNHGFGGNPRKVKRFVNSYYFVKEALKTRTIIQQITDTFSEKSLISFNNYPKEEKYFYLAKILIIQMIFPNFYDYLVYNNNGLLIYESGLVENADDSKNLNNFYNRYPSIKPCIEDNNLRKFMIETKSHNYSNFPENPPNYILKYLLLLVGLVEGGKSKQKAKSGGSASPIITSGTPIIGYGDSKATDISDYGPSSPTVK